VIEFRIEDEQSLTNRQEKFVDRTPLVEEKSEYFPGSSLPKPNTAVDAVDFTVR
jgi:hypothetical protein